MFTILGLELATFICVLGMGTLTYHGITVSFRKCYCHVDLSCISMLSVNSAVSLSVRASSKVRHHVSSPYAVSALSGCRGLTPAPVCTAGKYCASELTLRTLPP